MRPTHYASVVALPPRSTQPQPPPTSLVHPIRHSMIDMAPSKEGEHHKVPRGQTIVHIVTLLFLAYKLNRKVNKKVGELSDVKGRG